VKTGIADVAVKIVGDLKSGRRSAPVGAAPAPDPDENTRRLLALRHYLSQGMALDEAVAAANRAVRRRKRGDESL
jgi:hypothetical protein